MESLMFWNDIIVGGCLLGAGISLIIFIILASKPSFTYNDTKHDQTESELYDLLQKEKSNFVK